jgi:BASS family bile acid:Na+ symporter
MLLLLLKISIGVLIFAIGMTATTEDIVYLWRRPVLLAKSIAAMYVVMPILSILIVYLFDLPPKTELALVILAICAGAPLLPKKLIKFGSDPSYVFSLIVTTSLLAIITVPASLYILAKIISFKTSAVTPFQVAGVILKTFLVPLGVGMILRLLFPALTKAIGSPLLKIGSLIMGICAITALVASFHLVLNVGFQSVLAFALFTSFALLTGHILGGPALSSRIALAISCSSRHIGLALLIAVNARGQETIALVVAYLLASAVVSMLYIFCMSKLRKSSYENNGEKEV